MRILVNGAVPNKIKLWWPSPHLGQLFSPSCGVSSKHVVNMSVPWAADNDCFTKFNAKEYCRMLARLHQIPGCLFVTSPDVVGDATTTISNFNAWQPVLHHLGFKVALVAQDGMTLDMVPWDRFDALFIGGTNDFKLGSAAEYMISVAKCYGKHVHVGRVNTVNRIKKFYDMGVDTIDGSSFSWYPNIYIPYMVAMLEAWERGEDMCEDLRRKYARKQRKTLR